MTSLDAGLADTMSEAFQTVCRSLAVRPGPHAADLIATKIVEFSRDGANDPDELSRKVLKSLDLSE
jgi:hypothetical protein